MGFRKMGNQEFMDTGLLGLINLLVLWPRGMALTAQFDEDGSESLYVQIVEPFDMIVGEDDGVLAERAEQLRGFDWERFPDLTGDRDEGL